MRINNNTYKWKRTYSVLFLFFAIMPVIIRHIQYALRTLLELGALIKKYSPTVYLQHNINILRMVECLEKMKKLRIWYDDV